MGNPIVNDSLAKAFTRKAYAYNYSIAAGAILNITGNDFGIEEPANYFVVGPISWQTGNTDVFTTRITSQNKGSNIAMTLRNSTNSTKTGTATIYVLYASNKMLD